jgi:hypothetical protein
VSYHEIPRVETGAHRTARVAEEGRMLARALAIPVGLLLAWKAAVDARAARWGGRAARIVWIILTVLLGLAVVAVVAFVASLHRGV